MRLSFSSFVPLALVATICVAERPSRTEGQPTEGVHEAESTVADLERSVRSLLHVARSTARRSDKEVAFAAVVPAAERLLATRPDAQSYELLVTALMGARRYEAARLVSQEWIARYPQGWTAHYHTGQSLWVERAYEQALPPLERAYELAVEDRDRLSVARGLGFVLEHLKRFEDAITVYDKVGLIESAARVRANLETSRWSHGPPEGCPAEIDEEAERLEKELKALEEGG